MDTDSKISDREEATALKKALRDIRRSEIELRTIVDALPAHAWCSRSDGYNIFCNQPWLDYSGFTQEGARGWTYRDLIHPEDVGPYVKKWEDAALTGEPIDAEIRFRRTDGEYRWFLVRAVPVRDENDEIIKWFGTNTDVDDRKKVAEALRASERFARGQAETLTRTLDGICHESEFNSIAENVLRALTTELDSSSCSVWIRNATTPMMDFEFALEEGQLKTKSDATLAAVSLSQPINGVHPWPEAFTTGKPVLLADIRMGPDFPWRNYVLAKGIVTILIVPMFVAGEPAGVIGIRFNEKRQFRPEEIELAQALANQAMLAMQLTRLSEKSRNSAVIAERNRFAREVHDTLAQGFTGVIIQLEAAGEAISQGKESTVPSHLERAASLARQSLQEARRSVRALRPQELEDKPLGAAIEELFKKITSDTPVTAELIINGDTRRLPEEWENNLLRIGQEVLTNVLRHSHATTFRGQLSYSRREVSLHLSDNGVGFDPYARYDGFGLQGIQERAETMGGKLTILSVKGVGTSVSIVLPINEPHN